MSGILKIRGDDGEFRDVVAIKGADGKSAYEQAVEGGYAGTEADFILALNESLANFDGSHMVDKNNPHHVTAAQVGALSTKGGTLTGHLIFENPSGAFAIRKDRQIGDVTHSVALGIGSNGATVLEHYTGDTLDGRLALERVANNPGALKLRDSSTGTQYKIYGEHNKPTAEDVGALSTKGGTLSDSLSVVKDSNPRLLVGNSNGNSGIVSFNNNALHLACYVDGQQATLVLTNDGNLKLWNGSDNNGYMYLNEHNRPTKEYTGVSGDQTVQVGGNGIALLIVGSNGVIAIASKYGTRAYGASGLDSMTKAQANFENGVLSLHGNTLINDPGHTYTTQVI